MLNCLRRSRRIDKIKIAEDFKQITPSLNKLIRKTAEFVETGRLDKIYVDKNNVLIDGYCSYLILKALNYETAKVVVVKEQKDESKE